MGRIVRVLPDVSGLDKMFDYLVPDRWDEMVAPGTLVRVDLNGRRVAGWVVDLDVEPPPGVALSELTKVSSVGPSEEILDLSRWAARRWAGKRSTLLKAASPDTMVQRLPDGPGPRSLPDPDPSALALVSGGPGVVVVQAPPAEDRYRHVLAAATVGDALVITPSVGEARQLGAKLRRDGGRVSLAGRDWALAAAGGVVIGSRKAAWATTRSLRAVVVLDEHDERLQEERNPTWHARDVAVERARRAGVPCLLVSASPSLAALALADRIERPSRGDERRGWPRVDVVDRRLAEPSERGLFSHRVVQVARNARGRVICVLNRKGRAVMLACDHCGDLVRTRDGERLMTEVGGELVGPEGETRPKLCLNCGGTKLKRLRLGVSRAREELEALVGEPVGEVTADAEHLGRERVLVGTEAILHRIPAAEAVVFLDFDQELLVPRYRAAEQAMSLLVRAATLVGAEGTVVVQTRAAEHRLLTALVRSDPASFAAAETELRKATGLPPFSALAEVSGAGAEALTQPLQQRSDVTVLGPNDAGRYLVRATDPDTLAAALADTPRPKARVRVAVDPPRV